MLRKIDHDSIRSSSTSVLYLSLVLKSASVMALYSDWKSRNGSFTSHGSIDIAGGSRSHRTSRTNSPLPCTREGGRSLSTRGSIQHNTEGPMHDLPPRPSTEKPRHETPSHIGGQRLSAEQQSAYERLVELVDKTLSTNECQAHCKDEKTVKGAAVAHKMPHFFTAECLRRYLVSRQYNERKAYEMLMHTVLWRDQHVPSHYHASVYDGCLKSRFMEWCGYDREGRPNLYLWSANADLSVPREIRVNYMIMALEKGISLMAPPYQPLRVGDATKVEQWNIVVDETGRSSKHTDNKFLSHVTPILTSHYAQRLHRCYVLNPGWLTQLVYSVVKMFLDEGTTKKIHMIYGKHDKVDRSRWVVPDLLSDFGPENVPFMYGGSFQPPLVEDYCRFFEGVPLPRHH